MVVSAGSVIMALASSVQEKPAEPRRGFRPERRELALGPGAGLAGVVQYGHAELTREVTLSGGYGGADQRRIGINLRRVRVIPDMAGRSRNQELLGGRVAHEFHPRALATCCQPGNSWVPVQLNQRVGSCPPQAFAKLGSQAGSHGRRWSMSS